MLFDHDGDGFKELSAWVGEGDGFLALDRNGDGEINDDKELFGDNTILKNGLKALNGFQALAELDDNHDGVINSSDEAYSRLSIWTDDNGDGVFSGDDLLSLEEAGIESISVNSTSQNIPDSEGNILNRIGSFGRLDGSIGSIGDYTLQQNNTFGEAVDWVEVPEDIETLPDLRGYGSTYDLHQAMARDTSGHLKDLVEQFATESNVTLRQNIMGQILFAWSGSNNILPNSRGSNFDARKLNVLEKFLGEAFISNNNSNPAIAAVPYLSEAYRELFELMYSDLMSQSHLKDLYSKIDYSWEDSTFIIKTNLNLVYDELSAELENNPVEGKKLLSEFARTLRGLKILDNSNYLSFRETFIMQDESLGWVIDTGGLPVIDGVGQGLFPWSRHILGTDNADAVKGSLTEGDGIINSEQGSDVIYGASRNELLINETGDSILVAGAGSDRIWAGTGDDVLDGGAGNDELLGEGGNDTYIFRLGSGQDKIIDTDPTAGNTDTIFIGSNLIPEDIMLRRFGNNLVVKINNTTDTLTVQDYFKNDSPLNRVEQIQFMDGTIWDDAVQPEECFGGHVSEYFT